MDIGTYFSWELSARGDAPCVRDDAMELSYAQFAERVEAVAEQLAGLGVGAGDVVATFLPNRAELAITLMAAWRLRAIGTPVNPGFTDTEAEYQLGDSGAVVVVGERPFDELKERTFVHVDDLATAPSASWTPPEPPTDADDALLIYTSGSTGKPKGVRLGHDNLRFMASSAGEFFSLTENDHALLILPLFHVNAICLSLLAPIIAGGQLSITGQFSVRRFFGDVARLQPTYFSAVPTIYALLVSQGDVDKAALSPLRFAICGAAPISKELLERVEGEFGFPIVEGYGLTEATCASACNPVDGVRKLGTVGPALPGQTIRTVDPEGHDVGVGERGEVLIGGPTVMRGYLNKPDATASTLVGGWVHTGDVGILDEDGYLKIVDRIKDMIIRGGENLYPKEIESALATNPGVLECAVVGAPDQLFGEVPVAFVVPYPESSLTPEELSAFVEPLLTKVKRPTEIHIVDALPRNPVGKIDKPGLRHRMSAAAT
ncbi:MAG: AMP-binding protein [Gordonia sp. (in: high G+C Gram-positive bacteria)]|uniref:class I adenylate-forming enzyme family protein n=1 Tax=Gordonia sp. (in: high G+C Gram-positive bacteria) TaxID=84139 RepID=UPI0039E5D0E7